jgi:hypothetical protein
MSQRIPIFIPTFISDQNYNPNRVLPRIFFFNGMVDCESYYIESGSLNTVGVTKEVTQFPYFDHYNVVSGQFPTTGSRSLLFNNEAPVYGQQPTETLFGEYWNNYITLLYSPKTRLLNASAIIPLADYFDMELNDVVNWRGNYYHLRAINDYSLKDGSCKIQLLGPIIADTFDGYTPPPPTTTTTTTTAAPTTTTTTTVAPTTTTTVPPVGLDWSFNESIADGQMILYINGNVVENRFNNSSGTYYLNVGDTIAADVSCAGCSSPNSYANAYTLSNRVTLVDADCSNGGTAGITTNTYTVVSGDIGTTITLSTYAACDIACV